MEIWIKEITSQGSKFKAVKTREWIKKNAVEKKLNYEIFATDEMHEKCRKYKFTKDVELIVAECLHVSEHETQGLRKIDVNT